jgi:hypothetical protein
VVAPCSGSRRIALAGPPTQVGPAHAEGRKLALG